MSKPLATYNADTGELRSNFDAFAERNDSVDSIVWKKKERDAVKPGDLLAEVQWAGLPGEPLHAPDGCTGYVEDINGNIGYEDLGDSPSQYLAQISK
jgi:hypothetical protein